MACVMPVRRPKRPHPRIIAENVCLVRCSKGTYIRNLVEDIGDRLGGLVIDEHVASSAGVTTGIDMALAMVEAAEKDGRLRPGGSVVEYTGGSTGPALALVCRAKGYRARIVISECFTEERMQLMRALGAELDLIPAVEERGRLHPRPAFEEPARAGVHLHETAQEPAYQTASYCLSCHVKRVAQWSANSHKSVTCEVCHGAAQGHQRDRGERRGTHGATDDDERVPPRREPGGRRPDRPAGGRVRPAGSRGRRRRGGAGR